MSNIRNTPKDPIRVPPLRDPGQSSRESLDNLFVEKLAPWLTIALFAIFMAVIEWLRWWLDFPPKPLLLTFLSIGIVVLAIRQFRLTKSKAENLKKGLKCERSIGQLLQTELLPIGYHVFHDCCFDGSNVDHVAIGPGGIFAIETKAWSKPHPDSQIHYDGENVTVDGMQPDRDPVRQASAGAKRIQDVLIEYAGRSPNIRPVVLFPRWFIVGNSFAAPVWVLNPDAFIKCIKKETLRLSPEDIQFFAANLARYIRSTL